MAARKTPVAPVASVITDPFRATGANLKAAAAAGDEVAVTELARRKANKAAPATA